MDCEKEKCLFCDKDMVIGKQKIMDMCLHVVCADCHRSRRADVCPRCAIQRKYISNEPEKQGKEKMY